jgi:hypothetical protein
MPTDTFLSIDVQGKPTFQGISIQRVVYNGTQVELTMVNGERATVSRKTWELLNPPPPHYCCPRCASPEIAELGDIHAEGMAWESVFAAFGKHYHCEGCSLSFAVFGEEEAHGAS